MAVTGATAGVALSAVISAMKVSPFAPFEV
jgi:hypothetical protein